MTRLPPAGVNVSPIRFGAVSAGMLLIGGLWLGALVRDFPPILWFLWTIPLLVGGFVERFVHKLSTIYFFYAFVCMLTSIFYAKVLWHALVLGSPGTDIYWPTILVAAVCLAGFYGGYQHTKNTQPRDVTEAHPRAVVLNYDKPKLVDGQSLLRSPSRRLERVFLRIRALTPLLIALGLNGAYMLSQQAIYWIFGFSSLFFCVTCILAGGAAWRRASTALHSERNL